MFRMLFRYNKAHQLCNIYNIFVIDIQCVGSGSGRIRSYFQDPDLDPQYKFRIWIQISQGSRKKNLDKKMIF